MIVNVVELITLDGIVSDPDGSQGTPLGGWRFRYGRKEVGTEDRLRLGPALDEGVLLLGRVTRQLFARIGPGRQDPRAARMCAAAKLVASRTLTDADASAWADSKVLDDDLVDAVRRERRDVLVHGSLRIADRPRTADLVDEYRLLTFPTVPGTGRRLFPAHGRPADLELLDVAHVGPVVLTRYGRAAR
ncbi:dihydrofolate reductase family protein [Actinacidiphila rubida]|uniref:RibD C-terminal domain-containing protein n=1 Tax=Actinacidiphila rubida TaxID=310780 RepID=A0A1H8NHA5_9ACTN|nr:dihydrofolate reductase family protein [Actinacidiphila rubida]SEO29004.1 RibD C-terminal domain-containing protein [Actinacidiphila rubida]